MQEQLSLFAAPQLHLMNPKLSQRWISEGGRVLQYIQYMV